MQTFMKKKLLIIMLLPLTAQAQTLAECQQAAERNYPLIRQYDLIGKTTDMTVRNIGKGWLPQVTAQAQATYQNAVTEWPAEMQTVYNQMGISMKGLRKYQYRVGIDIQQTVYDGGMIRSQKEAARRKGDVETAQTEVSMYNVRRRVNEMYFGLLLIERQIELNKDMQKLLEGNERKLLSMYRQGTAAESDYLSVKAERLNVAQQTVRMESHRTAVMRMLSTFCGMEVRNPEKPAEIALESGQPYKRPELKAVEAQLRLTDAQEKSLNAALMPRLSVFASGYYGYPGYNLFEDMRRHQWSWNGMVGARLSWNIGSLYTIKNDRAKIQLQRNMAETNRDVFLFNNSMEQREQNENIDCYRRLMADDADIISLRQSVRKSAESKLAHGIIDVNDLIKEINAENSARVQQSIHETEMLREMYNLKFTRNEE